MKAKNAHLLTLIMRALDRDPVDVANEVEVLRQFCQEDEDDDFNDPSRQVELDTLAKDPCTSFWMRDALNLVAGHLVDRHGSACAVAWCNALLCLVGGCGCGKERT